MTASETFGINILEPFAFQTTCFMERERRTVWRYYGLTRFSTADETVSDAEKASVINRSVALFRYLGGLPLDQEPPAAP